MQSLVFVPVELPLFQMNYSLKVEVKVLYVKCIYRLLCPTGHGLRSFLIVHRYGLILSQKKGASKTAILQKPSVFGDDSDDEVGKTLDLL